MEINLIGHKMCSAKVFEYIIINRGRFLEEVSNLFSPREIQIQDPCLRPKGNMTA